MMDLLKELEQLIIEQDKLESKIRALQHEIEEIELKEMNKDYELSRI